MAMNIDAIRKLIEPVAKARLSKFGYDWLEVVLEYNHENEEIIRARAIYRADSPKMDAGIALDAMSEMNDLLLQNGENRILFLGHYWPDDVFAEGSEEISRPILNSKQKRLRAAQ